MNSSFSTVLEKLQVAWDSTSLSALKECPRKYQYSIIEGWVPKRRSFHLEFGIYYHEALETYDRSRSNGATHDEACLESIRLTLQSTWNKELRRPWISGDSNKNRFTLIRTIVWYLEQFRDDPLQTVQLSNGQPAVELSFRFEFPYKFEATGETALLCGHLDRIGTIDGLYWGLDRKTSKHDIRYEYFLRYSPDNQMSCYSYAGKIILNLPLQGMIIDAAQVLVNGSRFQRGFANRTQSQLDEWAKDTVYWMSQAEKFALLDYWPMNDKSCFNYGGCPFREICAKSPEVREQWLKAGFDKRVWDPLQVRGDV